MTACDPGSSKANPSSSGRGYLIADGARRRPRAGSRCHSARRSPGRRLSRASCQAFLPLAIDADGRTLGGTGAPFLRQWVQPHRPDAERRRRSLPAAIVISCTLAGRRSGWQERAHHALACGGYHSRLSAYALVSNRALEFKYVGSIGRGSIPRSALQSGVRTYVCTHPERN